MGLLCNAAISDPQLRRAILELLGGSMSHTRLKRIKCAYIITQIHDIYIYNYIYIYNNHKKKYKYIYIYVYYVYIYIYT